MRVLLILAAVLLMVTGCSHGQSEEYQRFKRDCEAIKGFVMQTDTKYFGLLNRYERIVNNEIVYLPGFAP